MRAVLERVVPEAETLSGSADAIPLEDDAVDAVFVAEAFHWFGTSAATLAELARVLRPPGTLAILFNQRRPRLRPAAAGGVLGGVSTQPRSRSRRSRPSARGLWKTPFPGPFEPLFEESFPNPVELDRAQVLLRQASSWSMIAALPEAERAALLARLGELLPDGVYRHPLRTELYRTRLR